MKRGTTPTIELSVSGLSGDPEKALLTLCQYPDISLDKDISIVDGRASVTLTQAETLQFDASRPLHLQLKTKINGSVNTSDILTLKVSDVLSEVII